MTRRGDPQEGTRGEGGRVVRMHPSPDVLALLAIGEQVGTSEDHQHIERCTTCTSELQELSMAAGFGRQATSGDTLLAPDPDVWRRVLTELGLSPSGADGRPDRIVGVHVQLNALPRWPGSTGEATITEDAQGQRILVVRVTSPQPSTGRREVWLSDSLALHMTSMGYLNGVSGTFQISPTMDLTQSPLVDVSEQPTEDTSGVHSGNSVVRGRLPI